MSIASQLSFSTATSLLAGAAGSIPYQTSSSSTTFLSIGTNGYVLTSNGSAPYWAVSSGGGAGGSSTSTNTVQQTSNASYYPTFVDANNATATGELFYTTSSFVINPQSGSVGIRTTSPRVEFDLSSGRARFNTYLAIGKGPNNNDGLFWNITPSLDGTSYTPGYVGVSGAGSAYLGMPSGGNGGLMLRVYRHGTSSTPYNESSMTLSTYWDDSGNVGIGTSSPAQKLEVAGSSQTASTFVRIANNQGSITNNNVGSALQFYGWDAGITANIKSFREGQSYSPSYLAFETFGGNSVYNTNTLAERMRIDGYGNLFVGTTAQLNSGFTSKLTVNGSIVAGTAASTNGTILLQGYYGTGAITNFGTEYSSGGPVIGYAVYPSNAANAAFFSASGLTLNRGAYTIAGNTHQWYTGASQTVAIGSAVTMTNPMTLNASGLQTLSLGIGTAPSGTTGEIRATNEITAYYSSDINLKENIKLIVDPLGKLEQIRGVSYDWKDEHIQQRGGEDGYFVRKHDIGVIAQEVEAVLPEIVATRDDGIKVVKYEKLVALLIEAVKDQQRQINQISQALQNMAIK